MTNKEYDSVDELVNEFTEGSTHEESQKIIAGLLDRAYDIRKFEIDLYWKRAGYFWGFLVATFAAYFIVTDKTKFASRPELEFLIQCIGLIFSLSWYLVNRGSKYWQVNWERIIDSLEEKIKKPLYRINLKNDRSPFRLFSRYPYSVSRINIIVSLFICCTWVCLIVVFLRSNIDPKKTMNLPMLLTGILTFVTTCLLFTKGRSNRDGAYTLEKRKVNYISVKVDDTE